MKEIILKRKTRILATGLILLLIFIVRFPFMHDGSVEAKDIKKLETAQVQIAKGVEQEDLKVMKALISDEEKKLYNLSIEHGVTLIVALVLGTSLAVTGLVLGRNKKE
ncbi:MAG: hypothetical protein LBI13_10955 [Streptococcaceae bacterium]|jgi:hypothetical protein|nr:hypothetical protein [Streptococcaceae bacterium]